MTRRIIAALMLVLVLAGSANAAALAVFWSNGHDVGSTTSNSITLPTPVSSMTLKNMLGVMCILVNSTTVGTVTAGWSQIGSTITDVSTTAQCYSKTLVAADAGTNVTVTYTSSFSSMRVVIFQSSDGVAPVVDASATANPGANTVTTASVTTALGSDQILWWYGANSSGCGAYSKPPALTIGTSAAAATGFFGQSMAGATTTATLTCSSHALGFTIAVKPSGAGSTFVGTGAENILSANSVTPNEAAFAANGDWDFVTIVQAPTLVNVVPPSDIEKIFIAQTYTGNGVNTCSVTIPNTIKVGDEIVAVMKAQPAVTNTSGPNCSGANWTKILTDNTNFLYTIWTRIATSCDTAGYTATWTNSANNFIDCVAVDFRSMSGGTLSVEANSGITTHAAATTFALSSVTTAGANRLVISLAAQNAANTTTVPVPIVDQGISGGHGEAFATSSQASAGASITPTISSNGSSAWEGVQLSLSSGGAGSPWTQLDSDLQDAGANFRYDLYYHKKAAGDPTWYWSYSATPTSTFGLMTTYGNLDSTTPVDAHTSLALPGMDAPSFPAITPTANDEILAYFTSQIVGTGGSVQIPLAPIYGGGHGMGTAMSLAHAASAQNQFGSTLAFGSWSVGLKAGSTPARTTSAAQLNQEAEIVISTDAPVSSSSLLWTPAYFN